MKNHLTLHISIQFWFVCLFPPQTLHLLLNISFVWLSFSGNHIFASIVAMEYFNANLTNSNKFSTTSPQLWWSVQQEKLHTIDQCLYIVADENTISWRSICHWFLLWIIAHSIFTYIIQKKDHLVLLKFYKIRKKKH